MELKYLSKKGTEIIKKYKYAFLILLLGIVLMVFPGRSTNIEQQSNQSKVDNPDDLGLESRLEEVLQQVEGAGNVKVILTVSAGEQIIYQVDENLSSNETSNSVAKDTITITGSDRMETGLIKQVLPVQYQGAIIVCSGADNPTVKLNIINAVAKLTGLGVNTISVLKMK